MKRVPLKIGKGFFGGDARMTAKPAIQNKKDPARLKPWIFEL
jgi:hypothetical protein